MASATLTKAADQRLALLERIQTTVQEINAAQDALARLNVGQRLVARVRGRLDLVFSRGRSRIETLEREVRAARPDDATDPVAALWREYAQLANDLRPARLESLAFVEGILLRDSGLDEGMCDVADELLEELSRRTGAPWSRFTILAEGEFFSELAGVIRLRYPPAGAWELPITAHEFGHLIAPRMETPEGRKPFIDLVQTEDVPIELGPGATYEAYLHEYFADAFATYALGPSYPAVCLSLRFDPTTAAADGARHPSAAKRAYIILRALEALDEGVISKPFADFAGVLRSRWLAAADGAGQPAELSEDQRMKLDALHDRLMVMLGSAVEPDTRYRTIWWRRAQDIADKLASRDPGPAPASEEMLADAINSAWLYRIGGGERDPQSLLAASRATLDLCSAIAQRRRAQDGGSR